MKILKKIILISSFLALPVLVFAAQVTVPSAPSSGYVLLSTSTGLYVPVATSSLGLNNAIPVKETPFGLIDGVNTTFTLSQPIQSSSVILNINGVFLVEGTDYTVSTSTRTITMLNVLNPSNFVSPIIFTAQYWTGGTSSGGGSLSVATTTGVFANGYSTYNPSFNTLFSGSTASHRTPYTSVVAASNIRVGYTGFYTSGTGNGITNLSPYPITVSFQRADPLTGNPTGTPTLFTFNGSTTPTIPAGTALTLSDALATSTAKGEKFFIINYNQIASAPINSYVTNQNGDNYSTSATTSLVINGNFTNDKTNVDVTAVSPSIVIGDIATTDKIGVITYGDSITQGSNDSVGNGGVGWVGKAMYSTNPVIDVGVGGSRASTFATDSALRTALNTPAQYARDALFAYGFNDVYSAQATATDIESNITTSVGQIRSLNLLRKIIGVTIKSSPSSTDAMLTSASQTGKAQNASTTLSIVNSWILASSNNTLFDGSFDFGGALNDFSNPNILKTGPAYPLFTDIAGTSTTVTAIRTSSSTVGDVGISGGVIKLTHSGTDYYSQIRAFRPGSPNLIFPVTAFTTDAQGDSYTVYTAWEGDNNGHPSGQGYAYAASQFPLSLVSK